MRYNVQCTKCNNSFVIESSTTGKKKVQCPYCKRMLMCQLGSAVPFRTKARSVVPIAESSELNLNDNNFVPKEKLKVLSTASAVTDKILTKSSSRLKRFQEKYADGDLWIFFSFSILFIAIIFISLYVFSQVISFICDTNNYIFKEYIQFKNTLGL